MNLLNATVYPSEEKTIWADEAIDPGYEGGAHKYQFKNSLGFDSVEKKAIYDDSFQHIQFVMKNDDGTMTPGVQSEQLVLALLDRTEKLNAKFPSEQNRMMMDGLELFLSACKNRIDERISRGVMGELKK